MLINNAAPIEDLQSRSGKKPSPKWTRPTWNALSGSAFSATAWFLKYRIPEMIGTGAPLPH
jgi:hypothetical protein